MPPNDGGLALGQAAVAADALGPKRVHTLMMPSPYTSAHSLEDAKACAEAIGVRYDVVGIEPAMEAFRSMTLRFLSHSITRTSSGAFRTIRASGSGSTI